MNLLRIGAIALCATLVPSFAVAASTANSVTIPMKALNGSGEDGTAVFTQEKDGVRVVVSLKNAPKGTPQPTHIHAGNCGNINKAPEYPLNNTVDGSSSSVVKGVKLSDLMASKYAVNVHKSGDDLGTYVSCGNINTAK
ncbi:MAG TPA: hypothetical protein VFN49_12250 [Candidatus Aquilonibacter sp.]|nr:hypothetical protein [Candidatus Aquilonibacter sp.]